MPSTPSSPTSIPTPNGLPLSHELLQRIITHLSTRRRDLLSLLLVSRTFYTLTLPLLYAHPYLPSPTHTHNFFKVLLLNAERQPWVKALSIQPGRGLHWDLVREGMRGMKSLESLLMVYNGDGTGGWVVDPPEGGWPFQLKELKMRMGYDTALASFLSTQHSLRSIQMYPISVPPIPLPPATPAVLPTLTTYDGTLSLLPVLLTGASPPPLTGVQIVMDMATEKAIPLLRKTLGKIGKALRGLSVLDVPDAVQGDVVDVIAGACPYLRHLGVLTISKSSGTRKITTPLLPLTNLTTLEMDLSRLFSPSVTHGIMSNGNLTYNPHAPQSITPGLRSIVGEVKMVRPSLKVVVVWVFGCRWKWFFERERGLRRRLGMAGARGGAGGVSDGAGVGAGAGGAGGAGTGTGGGGESESSDEDELGISPGYGMDYEWRHVMEHTRAQSGAQVGWSGWWNNWI